MSLILAIESSCDETAATVVKDGRCVLSNVISSQIETHKKFGGVVPEVASRKHLEAINVVIAQAVEDAGVTLGDLDYIAVLVEERCTPLQIRSYCRMYQFAGRRIDGNLVARVKFNVLVVRKAMTVNKGSVG